MIFIFTLFVDGYSYIYKVRLSIYSQHYFLAYLQMLIVILYTVKLIVNSQDSDFAYFQIITVLSTNLYFFLLSDNDF